MRTLTRVTVVVALMGALYWLVVPTSRVTVGGVDGWQASLVQQTWRGTSRGVMTLLDKRAVAERLGDLPVAGIAISRQRPWNATIMVDISEPDLAIRQGDKTAIVYTRAGVGYVVSQAEKSWTVVDVTGFPGDTQAFLSRSLEFAPMLLELVRCKVQLPAAAVSLSPSGLSVRLKDGKRLLLGDGSDYSSKIQRAVAVVQMPGFKGKPVTVDLRFAGQAVIPEGS